MRLTLGACGSIKRIMMEEKLDIKQTKNGVSFSVKVVPGSSKNGISGLLGSALKVNISSVAEKGKANQGLIKLLAGLLGCPKSAISIASGPTGPYKEILVARMTLTELENRLIEYI
jgi:uncharacterized protein